MAGIFGLSLGKTRATTILYKIIGLDHTYLLFKNNLTSYMKKLLAEKPVHILALGIYSGRDRSHIRIETVCKKENAILLIPYALKPDETFIEANSIGNSLCNFYTAELVDFVTDNLPGTSVTFLHIPKSFPVDIAVQIINNQLLRLK